MRTAHQLHECGILHHLRQDSGITMSDFSLIPERQLLFSPLLAATIGLDEAILLQHLQQLCSSTLPRKPEAATLG